MKFDIFKNLRIGAKLLIGVLSTSILIMIAIGLVIGFRINRIARDNAIKIAQTEAQKSANQLKSELDLDMGFSRALAHSLYIYPKFDTVLLDSVFYNIVKNQVENNSRYLTVWYTIELWSFRPNYNKTYGRRSITAYLNEAGFGIDLEYKNLSGDDITSNYYASKTCNCEMLLDPYTFTYGGKEVLATSLSVPIRVNGKFAGLGGVDISLEKFQNDIEAIKPYVGTTVTLVSGDGRIIANTDKELSKEFFNSIYPELEEKYQVTQKIKEKSNTIFFNNVNGEEYLNVLSIVEVGNSPNAWGLLLSMPLSEIVKDARKSVLYTILVFLFGIILQALAIWYVSTKISKPIKQTTALLNTIAEGDIDINKKIRIKTGDEIEEMANSANKLIEGLTHTEKFAREIGEGKLDTNFKLLSEKDKLGKALIEMQQSLIRAKELEEKRKEEEKQQNWATQGMALFGEVLRRNNDNIKELSYHIVKNLVEYTKSVQGGIFILNENEPNNPVLEMTACYAFNRRKMIEKSVLPNEGLVGRCFVEKKTILLKDIPKDYIKITSGLGEDNPNCLLIVPLIDNDKVQAVIELATFTSYQKYQIEFIEKLGSSIASTLANVKINIRTAQLLAQTQQQAEEMKAQEEEMRQNLEELTATQEEMEKIKAQEIENERRRYEQEKAFIEQLKQKNQELVQKQEELEWEQIMFKALMNALPARISFKDKDCKYIRINETKRKALNLNSIDDIINKSDFDIFGKEHFERTFKEDNDVMQSGEAILNQDEFIRFKDGTVSWGNTSRIPLKNKSGEIVGILVITLDVTEKKNFAFELELANKVNDTLISEYPALIYKIDKNGIIQTCKGKLLETLNLKEENLIGKSIHKVFPEVPTLEDSEINDDGLIISNSPSNNNKNLELKHIIFRNKSTYNGYMGMVFNVK
ncbi:GAF domain-containing protein [Tenuifilum thalassicum]|uniref:HAMP domain-containing protein n=1 Tax=Tenuifilum thalassicum TaxID=2590900 RepID=A0A7D4CB13_9BACT|nr:GAF domain-containing protein [Tenuifilum thalassicum]QKG81102.1 HAMP domain-containing protein [Tenuifilum thalassicum]